MAIIRTLQYAHIYLHCMENPAIVIIVFVGLAVSLLAHQCWMGLGRLPAFC